MNGNQLPDHIEQYLLDGQIRRATVALMHGSQISEAEAAERIELWQNAHARQDRQSGDLRNLIERMNGKS